MSRATSGRFACPGACHRVSRWTVVLRCPRTHGGRDLCPGTVGAHRRFSTDGHGRAASAARSGLAYGAEPGVHRHRSRGGLRDRDACRAAGAGAGARAFAERGVRSLPPVRECRGLAGASCLVTVLARPVERGGRDGHGSHRQRSGQTRRSPNMRSPEAVEGLERFSMHIIRLWTVGSGARFGPNLAESSGRGHRARRLCQGAGYRRPVRELAAARRTGHGSRHRPRWNALNARMCHPDWTAGRQSYGRVPSFEDARLRERKRLGPSYLRKELIH
jgi:hypothetical protein